MSTPNGRELEQRTRELIVLTEVATTLTAPLELSTLLGATMSKLTHVVDPADIGAILL